MAKILVKTPITTNGRDVKLNAEGRVMYSETIVEAAAKKVFEDMNKRLPQALKRIIEPYNEADNKPVEKEVTSNKDGSVTVKNKPASKNLSNAKA